MDNNGPAGQRRDTDAEPVRFRSQIQGEAPINAEHDRRWGGWSWHRVQASRVLAGRVVGSGIMCILEVGGHYPANYRMGSGQGPKLGGLRRLLAGC